MRKNKNVLADRTIGTLCSLLLVLTQGCMEMAPQNRLQEQIGNAPEIELNDDGDEGAALAQNDTPGKNESEGQSNTPDTPDTSDTSNPQNCHQGSPFGWTYCTIDCPCSEGEGDCDQDSECENGLICKHNVGPVDGAQDKVDICAAENGGTSDITDPLPGLEPSTNKAEEGQACSAQDCAAALTCTPVYSSGSGKSLGQFCMEKCNQPGVDPSCDGGESCVKSKLVGLVCFNPQNPNQGYTSPPQSGTTTPSPSPTPPSSENTGDAQSQEQAVLTLLNSVRAENGAGSLQLDSLASKAARAHSQDMCNKGYFSHTSQDGRSPSERLRSAGATFSSSGENIAMGQKTPQKVHDTWMNSSGHRSNMLNGSWTRVGIGYADCGGRPYWTEDFMR